MNPDYLVAIIFIALLIVLPALTFLAYVWHNHQQRKGPRQASINRLIVRSTYGCLWVIWAVLLFCVFPSRDEIILMGRGEMVMPEHFPAHYEILTYWMWGLILVGAAYFLAFRESRKEKQ